MGLFFLSFLIHLSFLKNDKIMQKVSEGEAVVLTNKDHENKFYTVLYNLNCAFAYITTIMLRIKANI